MNTATLAASAARFHFTLPAGLQESSELPEPIFTPATKAEEGHDENIPFEEAARIGRRSGC